MPNGLGLSKIPPYLRNKNIIQTTDAPLRGMIAPGNISLKNRPKVKIGNDYGTIRSLGANFNGKETLIPTIYDGKLHDNDAAIARYLKTGKHLGLFNTPEDATSAGEYLSNFQNIKYNK